MALKKVAPISSTPGRVTAQAGPTDLVLVKTASGTWGFSSSDPADGYFRPRAGGSLGIDAGATSGRRLRRVGAGMIRII